MLKILQARLQQYVNFLMFKLVLAKAEEPEIKLPTSAGSWKKQQRSRKTSISALFDYAKAFDCVDHNKLWKIIQEMEIPDHLTCLLRNLKSGSSGFECRLLPVSSLTWKNLKEKLTASDLQILWCPYKAAVTNQ